MTDDRWEIKTQRSHETRRMGYGQADYQKTIRHLAERGDTHADVWRENSDGLSDGWRRVKLTTKGRTA